MQLNEVQKKVWSRVQAHLADEQVASPDHVERMTTWCQKLGQNRNIDLDALTAGALVHDTGVTIDRKTHYSAGLDLARQILTENGLEQEKVDPALHVMQAHSRYGGPEPKTLEAQIAQDADALEYIGAIGIVRAVVRGLNDGSFSGKAADFPQYLRELLSKVSASFHTQEAEQYGHSRIAYMHSFLEQMEKELKFEV
jgi:uncharacterized protein